jgi:hypothetical protein
MSSATVATHAKDKNQSLAWIDLNSKMESQGNIGQIVANNTIELSNLELNYNYFEGFEQYQQKFENIVLRLSEAGEPFSNAMSKARLTSSLMLQTVTTTQ